MAVTQARVSLAQNYPAQPPALPAVVHRPTLRPRSDGRILHSVAEHSAAIFPAFSLIVERKHLKFSRLQIPSLKAHLFRQNRVGSKNTGSRRGTAQPTATTERQPQISPMTRTKSAGSPIREIREIRGKNLPKACNAEEREPHNTPNTPKKNWRKFFPFPVCVFCVACGEFR
jgi:hypothetical protein